MVAMCQVESERLITLGSIVSSKIILPTLGLVESKSLKEILLKILAEPKIGPLIERPICPLGTPLVSFCAQRDPFFSRTCFKPDRVSVLRIRIIPGDFCKAVDLLSRRVLSPLVVLSL